ncbi:uncharacterized protein LOC123005934 [Tribolium madens]|uniref:uncharacterized protein LOC123005934 n=1 Tax=Tribolium madens TaxID=41895 RepID=UPI001CF73E01|nr:uncharacterized protein LOC123005934 [Tribolium madens]
MFLVVLFVTSVAGDPEPTTTKTYDIEVPGSEPIRIVEGEPLWKTSRFEHRSFNTRGNTEDPLHQFLTSYAESVRNKNKQESGESELENPEKSKSWDLVKYQNHHHPYDDKKGWVSMEPVPWSVSKISKWQSNYRPSNPKPWDDYDQETQVRPWDKPNNFDIYNLDTRPAPTYQKPTAVYSQKVQVDYGNRYHQKHDENCKHTRPSYDDIITDGRPANFPQPYEANRRKGTEIQHDTHPFSGEGEWVLLSTTKGYKYPPNRQRALQINSDSIGAHRSVRLTVLPPLKNSKINMTTSHGGLLQVESSFQTVEQAHKQFNKKQKLKKKPIKATKPAPVRVVPTLTTTRRNSAPDSSAVLAAVGAGMIPATMAMLVPMALGGRRRRDLTSTPYPQVTLPRSL